MNETISRRSFVGAAAAVAVTAPALAASAAEADPIYAAIEADRAARARYLAAIRRVGDLEGMIPWEKRQTHANVLGVELVETDDPDWIAAEQEVFAAMQARDASASALVTILPTTVAGVVSALEHVAAVVAADEDWPEEYQSEADDPLDAEVHPIAAHWFFFFHRRMAHALRSIA
jgi:hypothetical protein